MSSDELIVLHQIFLTGNSKSSVTIFCIILTYLHEYNFRDDWEAPNKRELEMTRPTERVFVVNMDLAVF